MEFTKKKPKTQPWIPSFHNHMADFWPRGVAICRRSSGAPWALHCGLTTKCVFMLYVYTTVHFISTRTCALWYNVLCSMVQCTVLYCTMYCALWYNVLCSMVQCTVLYCTMYSTYWTACSHGEPLTSSLPCPEHGGSYARRSSMPKATNPPHRARWTIDKLPSLPRA